MSAIELNARASTDFDAKLAETTALLQQAAHLCVGNRHAAH